MRELLAIFISFLNCVKSSTAPSGVSELEKLDYKCEDISGNVKNEIQDSGKRLKEKCRPKNNWNRKIKSRN